MQTSLKSNAVLDRDALRRISKPIVSRGSVTDRHGRDVRGSGTRTLTGGANASRRPGSGRPDVSGKLYLQRVSRWGTGDQLCPVHRRLT